MLINSYKLKDDTTLDDIIKEVKEKKLPSADGGTYVQKDSVFVTFCSLADKISLSVAFPENLSTWNSYDYTLVLDEMCGQPFYPFYWAEEKEKSRTPAVLTMIATFNKFLDNFSFLEKVNE